MFLQVSVCPHWGCAWLLPGEACVVAPGEACMVAPGGHAWQRRGVRGEGGRAWYARPVIARAVRILLECIFVFQNFIFIKGRTKSQYRYLPLQLDHFPKIKHLYPIAELYTDDEFERYRLVVLQSGPW